MSQPHTPRSPHPGATRRTWGQRLVLLMNLSLIAASLTLAGLLDYANDRASEVNRVALGLSLTERPEAEPGSRVVNILLVGSDSSANLDPDDPIQIGRRGERLGDVIIVAHLDERTGDVALLSLPRDLWVPLAGTERDDRINRAFLVGGAGALIDTIEEAFDIPIHHYVNVDFAGFQGLVEAVETVEVYFPAPARDWNISARPEPRSQTGFLVQTAGCHALDPEQALAYVRSRYYQTQRPDGTWVTDPTSDLGRIARQQDFLQRLVQRAIEIGARNPRVLGELIEVGVDNVAIDQELTPSLLIDLGATFRGFEPAELQTYTFPVTDGTVGSNRVLIPQMGRAEPLLALFRGERFDAASTVGVELVYDRALVGDDVEGDQLPAVVEEVALALEGAGFEVGRTTPTTAGPGLLVRHGPDGGQAGELVATVLASSVPWASPERTGGVTGALSVEEASGLSGRNVVVAIGTPPRFEVAAPQLDPAPDAAPQSESAPEGDQVPAEMAAPSPEQETPMGLTEIPSQRQATPATSPGSGPAPAMIVPRECG